MHNQANYAGTASGEGMVSDRAIFMSQTISVQGELFNLFYDSGCGDLVCKKSAIDKLIGLGKASQEPDSKKCAIRRLNRKRMKQSAES